MAILAHVSFQDGATYEEIFRWRKSPAVWVRDDVERLARRMRSLIGREGGWRWKLEMSSAYPQLVVEGPRGTVRSAPLRLSRQVIEQVGAGGGEEAADPHGGH